MAIIVWKNEYSVKVKELDDQHKKLIQLISFLNEAMKDGKGKEVIEKVVNELIEYTQYHFGQEEKYFSMYNYPEKEEHIKEHVNFKVKVLASKDKLLQGIASGVAIEVMNFLCQWLEHHIVQVDKKYADFFIEKGLK